MTQLYPAPLEPRTLSRQVWNADTARAIPGVGRALDLIGGLASQMSLDVYAGIQPMPRPRLLEQPDLDLARSTFVRLHMDDYLLHGNACHLVTARGSDGYPAAVKWYAAHEWHVNEDPRTGRRRYWLRSRELGVDDVIHVQNGADPLNPARGVGVVERYIRSLDRVGLQEERERQDLTGGQVPSVAVIAPAGDNDEDELDAAAEKWEAKFSGPGRRPAILPNGTTVTPLGWNPSDGEAQAARKASLTDVANMFNLDGYWIGAPASSHTYRTPGAMFLVLLRTTLNPVLAPFEDTWSLRWLVRGKRVTFARAEVLEDDQHTTVNTLTKATGGPVMTTNEARTRLRLAPVDGGDELRGSAEEEAPDPEPDEPTIDPPENPADDTEDTP